MTGIPVDRLLVPDAPPAVPAGATQVLQPLLRGLPQELPLDATLSLVITVPTGIAVDWRDADPATVVASAADERAPSGAQARPALARPPVRLALRRAGGFIAGVPLVLGAHRFLPDDGAGGAVIELTVLDYLLHAGTLCGPGDFGSLLRLAWRRCDAGVDHFALPPLPPRVAERFVAQVQSQLGGDAAAGDGP
jgi:hypothetical protein